jgi:hypothetical protein
MHSTEEKLKAFKRLLDVMDELREKCPWDREQTLESLRNLTIRSDQKKEHLMWQMFSMEFAINWYSGIRMSLENGR